MNTCIANKQTGEIIDILKGKVKCGCTPDQLATRDCRYCNCQSGMTNTSEIQDWATAENVAYEVD